MNYSNRLSYKVLIVFTCEILTVLPQLLGPEQWTLSEDGRLRFPELAVKYGHPAETKTIITEDGYILTMYHIPGDRSRPVLLVHGNSPTVECWIIRGNISLVITLADQGYDVWVLALRGSRHSRRHVSLDPKKDAKKFFNFDLYEQAVYDLASGIDLALQETGQSQILVIGHSSGNTLFYILGSERPEYNDKIKLAISLAPICFLKNSKGFLKLGYILSDHLGGLLDFTHIYEIGPTQKTRSLCLQSLGYELCIKGVIFAVSGYDEKGLEPEFVNTMFGHWPVSVSSKSVVHEGQIATRDKFARFDYGTAKNLEVYGTKDPPEYDLSKVTMKSALFWGKEDFFTAEPDVIRLHQSLPNVVHSQRLPYKNFNHGDFILGRYMDQNLYPYLLPVIAKYS